ncbi:MAG: TIGR02611 family protein [Pseudonocardia sp.]|nr:TIGR02611 family protein [Pseudonocardia sp.]
MVSALRAKLDSSPVLRRFYRIGVGALGGLVIAIGIVLIPYPGPGWLVVFAGLAVLATEFAWARRVLRYARARYDAWARWLRRQHWSVRLLVLVGTGAIVLAVLWLLSALAVVTGWFGLHWTWVRSPLL